MAASFIAYTLVAGSHRGERAFRRSQQQTGRSDRWHPKIPSSKKRSLPVGYMLHRRKREK